MTTWAQIVCGEADKPASDFPSLSGPGQTHQNTITQSNWNAGNLRTQSRTQQALPSQRVPSTAPSAQSTEQSPPDQRNGTGDEFPPLNGQVDIFSADNGLAQINGQANRSLPYRSTQQTGLPSRQHAGNTQMSPSTQSLSARAPGTVTKRYADMTESEKYGLEGLAAAYEARKASEAGQAVDETLPTIMRSGLFFGQDLNALGMDLDSPHPIWPSFTAFPAATSQAQGAGSGGGMFDYHDRAIVPDFFIPPAYTVTNVPPLAGRLGSLSDGKIALPFTLHSLYLLTVLLRDSVLHILPESSRSAARTSSSRTHHSGLAMAQSPAAMATKGLSTQHSWQQCHRRR